MTKRSLLKWLDVQKQKALNDTKVEHNKVYEERKDAIFRKLGLKEVADGIQEHLTSASKIWDAWKSGQKLRMVSAHGTVLFILITYLTAIPARKTRHTKS